MQHASLLSASVALRSLTVSDLALLHFTKFVGIKKVLSY